MLVVDARMHAYSHGRLLVMPAVMDARMHACSHGRLLVMPAVMDARMHACSHGRLSHACTPPPAPPPTPPLEPLGPSLLPCLAPRCPLSMTSTHPTPPRVCSYAGIANSPVKAAFKEAGFRWGHGGATRVQG